MNGVTDPVSLSTSHVYDDLGRLSRVVSPASGRTDYTYDPAGNMLTETDGANRVGTRAAWRVVVLFTHDFRNINASLLKM